MAEINHRGTHLVLLHQRSNRNPQITHTNHYPDQNFRHQAGIYSGDQALRTRILGRQGVGVAPSDTSNILESLRLFTIFLEVTQSLSPLACQTCCGNEQKDGRHTASNPPSWFLPRPSQPKCSQLDSSLGTLIPNSRPCFSSQIISLSKLLANSFFRGCL